MRLALLGLMLAPLVVSCTADPPVSEQSATRASKEDAGRFVVSYEPATTDDTGAEEEFLRDRRVLEDFADGLNEYIRIPADVQVIAKDCEEENAYYVPDEHAIELCYELASGERARFAAAGDSGERLDTEVYQSIVATLYHELGHALIGELDLKVTGREEDVADQMAAYILTSDNESKDYLLTTADSFALSAGGGAPLDDSAFADTHSLDEQRSVNFLCYVYGSDEKTFQYLVEDEVLNSDRAENCASEYEQLVEAWDALLKPYLR